MRVPTLCVIVSSFITTETSNATCFDNNSCLQCLDGGCDWSEAGCIDSCDMIADASCYSFQYFENMTSEAICAVADSNKSDSDLCGSQTDCSSCVESVLSDGINTCQWFEEGFCASGCNMIGCGETTCPSDDKDTVECSDKTSCRECLDGCDWSEVGCFDSCGMVADVGCYSSKYFKNMTIDEICTVADTNEADSDLCGSQTDCSSCVGSVLSDGINTCQWFEEGFCASGCNMIGCGETICPSEDNKEPVAEIGNTILEAIDAVEESATGITSSASTLVNQVKNEVLGSEAPTISPTMYVAPETQVDKVIGQITDTVNVVAEASGNVLNEVYNP